MRLFYLGRTTIQELLLYLIKAEIGDFKVLTLPANTVILKKSLFVINNDIPLWAGLMSLGLRGVKHKIYAFYCCAFVIVIAHLYISAAKPKTPIPKAYATEVMAFMDR